ncbi:hypothetical protein N7532_004604 [Penicillium argentinense]|uniref:Ribonuclease H2 subunit B n=1 Tax=Penicillium argentinense TaxID=1131581 RepID=A0A9W9FQ86_9EURO|nr:uncharacterized protein N7532_004604 [Penicillium argentinense]KAJ5104075.1 hypothetical protein N7532_004604 [Penicillium argentinense]
MPRTRSTAPAPASAEKLKAEQEKTLTPAERPSKTFVLPSSTSANARLLSLPNPQSGELTRYFFCPERGIFEFTIVASPPSSARSILFTPRTRPATIAPENEETATPTTSIAKKAELLVATPIDSIFFLISLFAATSKSGQSLFQPLDDIIDSNDDLPLHLRNVLYDDKFRETLLARAEAICDTVEAGDEKMLRFSEAKLLKELVAKAERMATQGLPASLEERFVRQPLAPPLMSVKREDALTGQLPGDETASSKSESQGSPSTVTTTATPSVSTPVGESTPAPQPPTDNATSDHIYHVQRVSTALTFIKDSYLPKSLCSRIDEMLASTESPLDFKPLTDRLEQISHLRAEALASRTMSDFSRKRGLDDEEVEARAEKKRKKEDEEKKGKAAESRGVRDLKKVNTTGMKKMSDFFGKAAAK